MIKYGHRTYWEERMGRKFRVLYVAVVFFAVSILNPIMVSAGDLPEIKASGVLRHLGIPYAHFITGLGDGLDVEIIKAFCDHIGVKYQYVQEDWATALPNLVGKQFKVQNGEAIITGDIPVKGDLLANGLTVLSWRSKLINYSTPTFPTQVWLVVRSDSVMSPITPTGDIMKDIELTRAKIRNKTVLCKSGTCLDPTLFNLPPTGATAKDFAGSLNDLAPAVIVGDAEVTLLDVPDAMVALQKYPGKIKIIGPITAKQEMAVGFRKDQPLLRDEFNKFFAQFKSSGKYDALVKKYYPLVFNYFPEFFAK